MHRDMDSANIPINSLVGGILKKIALDDASSDLEEAVRGLIIDSSKQLEANGRDTSKSLRDWGSAITKMSAREVDWDDNRWGKLIASLEAFVNISNRRYGGVIDNIEELALAVRSGGFPKMANDLLDLRRKWVDFANGLSAKSEKIRVKLLLAKSNKTPKDRFVPADELSSECASS